MRKIIPILDVVLLTTLVLLPGELQAYDSARCKKGFPEKYEGKVIGTTQSSTSSSQFTSSWGACAAIGMHEQREQFLYANTDHIMLDSARGQGEYIDALARLSGCNQKVREGFRKAVRENFEKIYFTSSRSAKPEEISDRLDHLVSSHSDLRRSCKISS